MAVNLRLAPDIASALRERSRASGVSQQEILRRALEHFLEEEARPEAAYRARLMPPRRSFQSSTERLELPEGVSSETILDREDRI
jgi:hypothetical protein